jgi:hypothetical protein
MRRGRHASPDNSFGRSAAVNAGRGAILILVALVIGVILLQDYDDGPDNVNIDSGPRVSAPDTTITPATVPGTTTIPARANRDVKVLVVNGTTTAGAAARVAQPLRTAGYNVLAVRDASPAVKRSTRSSVVYYASKDYEREAKALQQALGLPPTPVQMVPTPPPVADTSGANVIIVVGPDLATPAGGTTTTTIRRTTTTTTG